MRNFRVFTGHAMAATASLLLMTACGGGSDGDATSTTTSTSSTTAETTTSTEATTTTTSGTTTTTLADPFNLAAATLAVQHSGFCMTADAAPGTNVRQFACATADVSQRWEVKPSGTDYTIRNLQTNLCLRVNEAALNADPNILSFAVQGPCDGSTNVLWNFQPSTTAGQFHVVAKHSGLCLDVTASDLTSGKEIIQYTCNTTTDQPNQRWKITTVAP